MTYKAVKNEIRDQDGKQVAVVLPTSCSRKVAAQMAARCAEWLNVEERNKVRRITAAECERNLP